MVEQKSQQNKEDAITVEILDTPEQSVVELETENMIPEEKALAEKHGLLKKEESKDELKVNSSVVPEDSKGKEVKKEEVESVTFEQVEDNEKLLDKYNRNEKALYWKWKTDKNKRQEAQKERDAVVDRYGLDSVKAKAYEQKLEKLNKLLTDDADNLTVESIRSVLNEKVEPSEIKKEEPKPDEIQKKVASKAQYAEKIGESRYENFQAIANLAKEVISNDKSGTYQSIVDKSFVDDNIDESMLVERIVGIAKLSDKYNEITKSVKPEDKEIADRALKNSKKKINSASLPSSGGRRVISSEDLTIEDAARLSNAEWAKLPQKTKQRILMGLNP